MTNPNVTNPNVTNPNVTNPNVTNPNVTNPNVTNPNVTNPNVTNADLANPNVTNPNVTNPNVTNPNVTNPNVTNPNVTNAPVSDATYTVTNEGNTAATYHVQLQGNTRPAYRFNSSSPSPTRLRPRGAGFLFEAAAQRSGRQRHRPGVHRPGHPSADPGITDPSDGNATFVLGPGESILVTIRGPVDAPTLTNIIQNVAPVVVAHAPNTNDDQRPRDVSAGHRRPDDAPDGVAGTVLHRTVDGPGRHSLHYTGRTATG